MEGCIFPTWGCEDETKYHVAGMLGMVLASYDGVGRDGRGDG